MKAKSKYMTYFVLLIIISGVAYTACKNVIPEKTHIEKTVELRLNK